MAGEFGYSYAHPNRPVYTQFETGKLFHRDCVVQVLRALQAAYGLHYGEPCVQTKIDYEGKSCSLCGKPL
jgi:hypothetical protein